MVSRQALMSTCSYPVLAWVSPKYGTTEMKVHKELCRMLADVRAQEEAPAPVEDPISTRYSRCQPFGMANQRQAA